MRSFGRDGEFLVILGSDEYFGPPTELTDLEEVFGPIDEFEAAVQARAQANCPLGEACCQNVTGRYGEDLDSAWVDDRDDSRPGYEIKVSYNRDTENQSGCPLRAAETFSLLESTVELALQAHRDATELANQRNYQGMVEAKDIMDKAKQEADAVKDLAAERAEKRRESRLKVATDQVVLIYPHLASPAAEV